MELRQLKKIPGARSSPKRVGRGPGSGMMKTACRGMNGAGKRGSKKNPYRGFEGGQMPLVRRLPKRGFNNFFRKTFACVNLDTIEQKFNVGEKVDLNSCLQKGIVHEPQDGLKILGNGEITKKLEFTVKKISAIAKEKIHKTGGVVHLLVAPKRRTKKFRPLPN